MMYYIVNTNDSEEFGFFKSNLDMKNGGSVFAGLQDFIIVGYSVDEIKIGGLIIDLGTINDVSDFFSAQKWTEDGWQVIKPVEVHREEGVKELYRKFQYKPLMEYIGGSLNSDNDAEDLNMIPKMDEDDEMPF